MQALFSAFTIIFGVKRIKWKLFKYAESQGILGLYVWGQKV